jgi:glucose-1-phosphate thymidylyltransferase
MVDWILDKIREAGIADVHLVTNGRFAEDFGPWAEAAGVHIHDDGTTTNETRLGAIGDIRFVQEHTDLDDDLLVIAGDNLFDFSLDDYVAFWRTKGRASAVAVRDVGSKELASQYGVVALDDDARVIEFVEKPADPPSTLAAVAIYLFHRGHVALIRDYLAAGESADQPGRFVAWLQEREPVYGWIFDSTWYDIGNHEQLLEADNRLRAEAGLPERDVYAPE